MTKPDKAILTICHDDGNEETMEFLAEEFARLNLVGSVALVTKKLLDTETGERNEEAIRTWRAFFDTGRFELLAHSRTHIFWGMSDSGDSGTFINYEDREVEYSYEPGHITREIAGCQEELRSIFPEQPVDIFAKPGFRGVKTMCDDAYRIVKEHYFGMRGGLSGHYVIPPVENPYQTPCFVVTSKDSPQRWIDKLEEVIAQKGWISVVFHPILRDAEGKGLLTVSQENTRIFLEYAAKRIADGDLVCMTQGDALKACLK